MNYNLHCFESRPIYRKSLKDAGLLSYMLVCSGPVPKGYWCRSSGPRSRFVPREMIANLFRKKITYTGTQNCMCAVHFLASSNISFLVKAQKIYFYDAYAALSASQCQGLTLNGFIPRMPGHQILLKDCPDMSRSPGRLEHFHRCMCMSSLFLRHPQSSKAGHFQWHTPAYSLHRSIRRSPNDRNL